MERLHQHLELFVPQQIATYGGGIQVRNVEIDEGIINLFGRGSADVLRLGPFERRIDLATGQMQPADGTVAGERRPVSGLIAIGAHHGRLGFRTALLFDQTQ